MKDTSKIKNIKQAKEKVIKAIKNTIIKDIKKLFEEEVDFYKLATEGSFYSSNYIEYEINSDINKTL